MEALSNKTKAFLDAITARSQKETEEINARVRRETDEILSAFEATERALAERESAKGAAEEKLRLEKSLATERLEARRAILRCREECGAEAYAEVMERLRRYPQTPEYGDALAKLLIKGVKRVGEAGEYTVSLRSADMKYGHMLAKALPGARLTFKEGAFALGGLIIECGEKNLRVDMTYDSAFADLKGRFAELTLFRVED